jgi:hypothetical protein
MGGMQTKTRSKKGVVYLKTNNEIIDCLFCRIARGESPPNQLWYQDDRCAVFIPRSPAARLHLLIVPLQHIQNISSLTEEHRPLLEHMKKVMMIIFRRIIIKYFILDSYRTTSRPCSTFWTCCISTFTSRSTTIFLCIQSRRFTWIMSTF